MAVLTWNMTMKIAAIVALTLALTGCAGLNSAWRFQMDLQYQTPQKEQPPAVVVPRAAV